MKAPLEQERTITVHCDALKKILPHKLAKKVNSITVMGQEDRAGLTYRITKRMVFTSLMMLYPEKRIALKKLLARILKNERKTFIIVSMKDCEECISVFG